jgi:signal transduction histidine kinase/ligand-binding sensor domain-containing protein
MVFFFLIIFEIKLKNYMQKLIVFFFFLGSYFALGQNYDFKSYTTKEGLAHNQAFSIIQAKNQRIWVATLEGVSCFNGTDFKNFTTKEGLSSNICLTIFEDSNENIWVGTLNKGISIISNGKIKVPVDIDFNMFGSITNFLEAKDGSVYIFSNRGLIQYKNEKYTILYYNESSENIFATSAAWYDDNTIYCASIKDGVKKITLNPFNIQILDNKSHNINNICYKVIVDKKKNIWIGSYGVLYLLKNNKFQEFVPNINDINSNRVFTIFENSDTTLGIGFEGNGIAFFNKKSGNFDIINSSNGLPSNYIYGFMKDSENNYWMASFEQGIIRFKGKCFQLFNTSHGLPSEIINDVEQWNNQLYVASEKGLVIYKENKIVDILFPNSKIYKLVKTPQNNLLVATGEKVAELSQDSKIETIAKGTYLDIYKDKDNTFLSIDDELKVIRKDSAFNLKTRKTFKIIPLEDRYVLAKLNALLQYKNGEIDTIPGLHPSKHNLFKSIDVINNKEFLALNNKFIYHVSLNNKTFEIKTFELNRFGNYNYSAIKIDKNNLWLGSKSVISKVDLKTFLEKNEVKIKHYLMGNDFIPNGLMYNGLKIDNNGILYACTLNGLFIFDEKAYIGKEKAPSLNLKNILLFSESILDKKSTKSISLSYKENYLTFFMEAITYSNPKNVNYKYRLKGLRDNDEWSEPTKDNKVVFSYIPPGDYEFEFTADNGNDFWQPNNYKIEVHIQNPFWRTWWFWLFLSISLALLIIIYFTIRNKNALKQQEKTTQYIINAQEEERTRVALELHDSVGQQLMLLTRKANSCNNESMEALAKDTLQNVRNISQGLHPAVLERLGFTAGINDLINIIDTNTNLFFTAEIENVDIYLDNQKALHIYRIVQELLNNIVKHAEATSVTINIHKLKSSIEIIIEDNGKGFDYEYQKKFSKSLGMKSLVERSKIINAKLNIISKLKKGTIIQLIFPIQ